ncbi:MAG: hypothetical protein KJ737_20925 [Proteobacteria bacterium]|nr:hypothetical protein [Pseudomonadota bacterium]
MGEIEKTISFFDLGRRYTISTGHTSILTVEPITMLILEMEDVLFHLNSAVMMPKAPQGESSSQGREDDSTDPGDLIIQAGQQQMTGLGALALVFRELEFNSQYRILIAGHTDTSGGFEFNYDLSELRAKCVLYLLTGEKDLWAENSASRHKVEDYQQIMKYFSGKRGWACDPGDIDDDWGDHTSNATEVFFQEAVPEESEQIVNRIRHDPQKRWHERAWEIVYDLYNEELAEILGITPLRMVERRGFVRFLDDETPFVACGESFPVDDAEKTNYKSQLNRRVEILFFDSSDTVVIQCPATKSRAHTEAECPLRIADFIHREYLDPNDLYGVAYHLKFEYYDRIKKQMTAVPQGLTFKSFQTDGTEIRCRSIYNEGVYTVVVQFPTEADANSQANGIHFTFETRDAWLFSETDDASVPPVMVDAVDEATWNAMTTAQRDGHVCFANMTPVDKYKYYDLPALWDSLNWPCKVSGTRDQFSTHMGTRTSEGAPIVFNLDTLVLLDRTAGTQGIQDENHLGAPVDLDGSKSRIKLFCADPDTGELVLFKTGAADNTSRFPFPVNRISEDARDVKIVFFKDKFYPVLHKRTSKEPGWVANGYIVGARAAVQEDSDCCLRWEMQEHRTELGYTGDYDLCYFHQLGVVGNHPVSYLVIYVSISFMRDSRYEDGDPDHDVPAQNAVNQFINLGVYNAMNRYNNRKFYFDEETEGDGTDQIRPYCFFDERETFQVNDASRPTDIDFDDRDEVPDLLSDAAVQQACEDAYGGKSKFLALICADDPPGSNYGAAYQWAIRNETPDVSYSLFHLNESAYHAVTGPFSGVFPFDEDHARYRVFTFAHELGHAIGNADEYLTDDYAIGSNEYNSFSQFFECYTMLKNRSSLMYLNGAPRTHHLVYALNKLNREIQSGRLHTKGWHTGKYFVGKYECDDGTYIYTRRQAGLPVPMNPRDAMHHEGKFQVRASNPRKTLYLALYYVSQDQSSSRNFHDDQAIEYQAVLMVRLMLSTDFSWLTSNANRANKISSLEDAWSDLSCRYRLVNGSGAIENVVIHFLTGFSHDNETATRNYHVDFSWHSLGSGRIVPSGSTSDEITVRSNADGEDVVAYVLDIANKGDLNNTAAMVNHLDFLRQWVNTRLSDNFTLEAI